MPGLHRQPPSVPDVVLRDLARERRARADEAHRPGQHVPELRQLVDRGSPQEAPDSGDARVVLHLERGAASLVEVHQLVELLLRVADHRAELQHRERPPVEADALLAEEDRRAIADAEGDRGADEERAEEDQADGGPDDVHEALQEQADLALAVVDERADEEPIELLLHRAGKDLLDRVDRHADRLPLAGRQPGDRLQVAGSRCGGRQTATSSTTCEWKISSMSPIGPRIGRVTTVSFSPGTVRCPMIWSPRPGWLSTRSAKLCARVPVAGHEHVARIAPEAAVALEDPPQDQPADERDRWLRDEEEDEEEAADVGALDDEEHRQDEGDNPERGARDVADLGPDPPAHVQPIQPGQPQRGHPDERPEQGGLQQVESERLEQRAHPAVVETDRRHGDEDGDRDHPVEEHQPHAEGHQVAPNHGPRWYRGRSCRCPAPADAPAHNWAAASGDPCRVQTGRPARGEGDAT